MNYIEIMCEYQIYLLKYSEQYVLIPVIHMYNNDGYADFREILGKSVTIFYDR